MVNFDSNRLTSDCIRNGCQLAAQLKAITDHIGIYGIFGTCRVNVSVTKAAMEAVIEKRKIFKIIKFHIQNYTEMLAFQNLPFKRPKEIHESGYMLYVHPTNNRNI